MLEKATDDYKTATAVLSGETETSYTPSTENKGKFLQVVVTDTEGNVFASPVSSQISGEDLSAEVKIVDQNGLQADGTALPTDTLHLSYGAELGTPETIIWYKDGAAMRVYTSRGGFTNAFDMGGTPAAVAGTEAQAAGEWYVVIQNTEGKNFTSNSIVVAEVGVGSVSDVSAQDDYETANAAGLSFATADDKVVLSATLNKDYKGKIYVYDESTTSYDIASAKAILDLGTGVTEDLTSAASLAGTSGKTGLVIYTKKTGMTTKNAYALANGNGTGDETAIKYVDPETGATTYMFVPETGANGALKTNKASLVRGSSYKIVFDQEDIDSDTISSVARKDVTATEAFTIPYLNAPKAIKVVDVVAAGSSEKANVQLYADEAMTEPLAWLGDQTTGLTWENPATGTNVALGIQVKAFTNTKAATTDGTPMTAPGTTSANLKGGKLSGFTGNAVASGLSCLYATATFETGIWGAKKIELTSAIASVPASGVGSMSTSYAKTAPNDIKVSFTGLKTEGKVYVVRTQRNSTPIDETHIAADVAKAMADINDTVVVGSADVARGSDSVVVTNCVPRIYSTATAKTDYYSAVFVPSNTDDFQSASTTIGASNTGMAKAEDTYCAVTQLPTKYAIGGTAKKAGNVPDSTSADTTATLEVEDQFGNEISTLSAAMGTTTAPTTAGNTSFTGATGDSVNQLVTVYVGTDRKIQAVGKYAAGIANGDTYKYKIEDGWFICFKVSDKGSSAATAVWEISITNE